MDLGLKNKVAIVSGSSDGMGRATAEAFAAEGVNVAMCARTENQLLAAADEIRSRYAVQVLAQPRQLLWRSALQGVRARRS